MRRAIAIARNGAGWVAPNPMVGAVLVQGGRILAEGWHKKVGGPHAEVECLRAFGDGPIPSDASLYVNLEPCSHHGRTPPCVDLVIARGVKRLVVAHTDPNPEVHGRGLARAREEGIAVRTGVCEAEARWLNRRFITFHEKGRPYIILKWARSADGFLDDHGKTARISSRTTDVLVHRWRSEEPAIVVGSRTVVNDDPQLTVRQVEGRQPLRVTIDRGGRIPATARIFDTAAPTLLITGRSRMEIAAEQRILSNGNDPLEVLLSTLVEKDVTSLLVEGGAELLQHFIVNGHWNEARVITGMARSGGGTPAPAMEHPPVRTTSSGPDRIDLYVNGPSPDPSWAW